MDLLRIFRHRWLDEHDVKRALNHDVLERLERRVKHSEAQHTGQVRLCIEAGLPVGDLLRKTGSRERALHLFGALRVWDTEHNNGVLIYLLLADHRIEIVADRALSRLVEAAQWQGIVHGMEHHLKQGLWETALGQAVDAVTELLKMHYPRAEGQTQVNELPDRPLVI